MAKEWLSALGHAIQMKRFTLELWNDSFGPMCQALLANSVPYEQEVKEV